MTLDRRELQEMRTAVEALFPDVAQLLTVNRTSDGAGGFTETWTTAVCNCPCRVDHMVGRELVTEGALRPFVSLEMAIPYDVTITEAYRVEYNGEQFNVINANSDQSWQIEKVILLEKA